MIVVPIAQIIFGYYLFALFFKVFAVVPIWYFALSVLPGLLADLFARRSKYLTIHSLRSLYRIRAISYCLECVGIFLMIGVLYQVTPLCAIFECIGAISNRFVMAVNGYRMPSLPPLGRDGEKNYESIHGVHSLLNEDTRFWFLGDWICGTFFFRHTSVSPGDIICTVGIVVGIIEMYIS